VPGDTLPEVLCVRLSAEPVAWHRLSIAVEWLLSSADGSPVLA
jgi:hypothetical protein